MKSVRAIDADFQAEADHLINICGSDETAKAFCRAQIEAGNMRYCLILWQIERPRPASTPPPQATRPG